MNLLEVFRETSVWAFPVLMIAWFVYHDMRRSLRCAAEIKERMDRAERTAFVPAPPLAPVQKERPGCSHCGAFEIAHGRCTSCGAPRAEEQEPGVHFSSRSGARIREDA